MAFGDYDSDDDYGNYNRGGGGSNNKPSSSRGGGGGGGSILKNSYGGGGGISNSKKAANMYSDDDDDDNDYYSNRSNNARSNNNNNMNRYDSPVNSHRSADSRSATKPPSGRMQPLQPIANTRSSGEYGKRQPGAPSTMSTNSNFNKSTANNKNANNFNDGEDSDDSFMQRYQKFTKAKNDTNNDYDSRPVGSSNNKFSSSKYDTYDEDEKNYLAAVTELGRSGTQTSLTQRNNRSSSLDRLNAGPSPLTSTMLSQYGNASMPRGKFNSTTNIGGIDNASDRSYTVNSMNSTTMSVRDAKSRSFLVGSLSALNGKGLLSSEELDRYFIDRKARVLVATWNMGGVKKPPTNLEDLVLPDLIQLIPDILIIGVQEFELNVKTWEVSLQEQIGPTHVKLSSYYHGSIGVVLFIKRELIWFCSVVEYEHVPLRSLHAPGRTKSSVVISFQLFGTLMCFICSHFVAGEANLEQRIDNYKSTIANIKLPKKLLSKPKAPGSTDGTDNFDVVFWFGDFNFLVTKERDRIEKKVKTLRGSTGMTGNYEEIINHDELNRVMSQDAAFKHFLEGRITFEPTYKYDIGSDNYDTSEKCRIPSYCDRILFRSRHKGAISCFYYDSIKDIRLSDHRAVFGLYEVSIRPGVDKIPLSYGDFDREIYAAAYQRRRMYRAANVPVAINDSSESHKSSKKVNQNSACIIQ